MQFNLKQMIFFKLHPLSGDLEQAVTLFLLKKADEGRLVARFQHFQ